jgi:hypothetical protein
LDTAIFELRDSFFCRAVGLMPQNGVETILVDPGEETSVLTFAPILKHHRNGKTPSTKLASRTDEKRAAILKRNERGCERWHSNKAEHAQIPTAAEALQQCFRSANADQNSFFFECIVDSRYRRNRDTKATRYLSDGIKNLRLFLLISDGDAAQNLKQLRTLVLLCLEAHPCRKRRKTSRHFLSGHYEFFVFLPLAGVFRKPGAKVKIK